MTMNIGFLEPRVQQTPADPFRHFVDLENE